MKNIYFLIAFLSTALLSDNAFSHEPSNTNELSGKTFSGLNTEAGRTVLSFHQALSNGQAERVMSALSPDVIILEGSRIERSAEEYRQHHLQADMRFSSAVETTTIEHYVRVYGDTAVSISRSHTVGPYKGKQIDQQGNETLVLKRIDGDWMISHIHWSH